MPRPHRTHRTRTGLDRLDHYQVPHLVDHAQDGRRVVVYHRLV